MLYFIKTFYYIFLNLISIFYKKKVDKLNEENTKKSKKTLNIALHGALQRYFSTFYKMLFYFNDKNVPLILLEYGFNKSIEDSALEINEKIDKLIKNKKEIKINLIGHSLGGIIARYYIQNFGIGKINKLILIGSPQDIIFKRKDFFGRLLNKFIFSFIKKTKDSYIEIIDEINKNDKFKNRISISGENDFIVPKEYCHYKKGKNYVFENLGHLGQMYDKRVFDLIIKEVK